MTRRRRLLAVAGAALALVGCGEDGGRSTPTATGATEPGGDLTVFAAASLTDAFTEIAAAFEGSHPGVDVTLAFDGSSALVAQLVEGAPADVFASADEANMAKLTEAELAAAEPTDFATNDLAIIVAPDNPLGIARLADLARDDVTVVLCAVEVPCGAYAERVLADAGVDLAPASYEQNVRGVASKVVEGEADAGIVYRSDVLAAGDRADLVEIPADLNVVATYPAAPVNGSTNPQAAAAFVEFLTGPAAQAILAADGFGPP